MAYDAGRGVYVLYGGFDADGGLLGDTWEWDGEWRCVAGCDQLPGPRVTRRRLSAVCRRLVGHEVM